MSLLTDRCTAEPRIEDKDAESFAAAAEAALACGWRYTVAARWREHVLASLDALSSQRRPLTDPLRLWPGLLAAAIRTGGHHRGPRREEPAGDASPGRPAT
jgi:hypothetical protein